MENKIRAHLKILIERSVVLGREAEEEGV